jgi:hypothetical protein
MIFSYISLWRWREGRAEASALTLFLFLNEEQISRRSPRDEAKFLKKLYRFHFWIFFQGWGGGHQSVN